MNNNSLRGYWDKIVKFFTGLSAKQKKRLGTGLGVIVVFAAVMALVMNIGKMNYKVLYSGLDASEASAVYSQLQTMGVSAVMDQNGDIKVPSSEYDQSLLQLAQSGYPQSALTYDLFSDHSGLTSTETEKKQWIIYQLQDRLQNTLSQMEGVEKATVTINIPDTSDYVWDQATDSANDSTASVLLTLAPGKSLTAAQIIAVQNLVASGTPKMTAENVTVVDANTMLELSSGTGSADVVDTTASFECEQLAQRQIEENVVRLLTPRYGGGGVVAVAKVKLNYDKMMTEKMELVPQPTATDGTGGGGYATHSEGSYTLNGSANAASVVGEENNTDIPSYAYNEAGAKDSLTDYTWSNDIDYSYIKTQIEKGNAEIENATISVMVNDTALSQAETDELMNLISKSTNIGTDNIFVSTFEKTSTSDETTAPAVSTSLLPANIPWVMIAAGAGGVLVVLLLLMFLMRRRKTAKQRASESEKLRLEKEEEERRKKLEAEIADYKKQLSDAASGGIDEKNEAIVEDVRNFARSNPAIAANLIRAWLREGDS